jgi:thiol-disulfide isomerase/thioredoxin
MILRSLIGAFFVFAATATYADETDTTTSPDAQQSAGQRLLESPSNLRHMVVYELDRKLTQEGEEADQIASQLLEVLPQAVKDSAVAELIEAVGKEKPRVSARLLLKVVWATQIAGVYDNAGIVVGQLVVEDGKLDPVDVFAQMPILEEGYFAGEIGDRKQPLSFRAHRYEDLDVPLAAEKSAEDDGAGDTGSAIMVGKVVLRPVTEERRARLRGRVILDAATDATAAKLVLNTAMPEVNTPSGGYSGRMSWPEGIKVEVDESGAFTAEGLSPSKYNVIVSADGHVQKFMPVTLAAGETTDAGDVRLLSSDLGFYVGHEAPETSELAWEADFNTALERSKKENRPLMVMMTATWCGPCKMLESQTLSDPWIRHFLSSFVVVKAYEDREVEQTYGLNGYPTLVFCDSSGKQVHKTVGNQPAHSFATQCAKAIKGLDAEMPAELQALIEKKVIAVE